MEPHLISYLTLRKLLGGLGIALPVVLPVGVLLFGKGQLQDSISHYYYTNMADVLVGILWSYGLFLFTYKGYKKSTFWLSDNTVTNIAGVLVICVAIFPTEPETGSYNPEWVGSFHLICAALFFLILGATSIFIFTESKDPPAKRPPSKKLRNRIYRVCGVTIWTSLLILLIYFLRFQEVWPVDTVFWFEALMLWAFGVSWLIKGRAFKPLGL